MYHADTANKMESLNFQIVLFQVKCILPIISSDQWTVKHLHKVVIAKGIYIKGYADGRVSGILFFNNVITISSNICFDYAAVLITPNDKSTQRKGVSYVPVSRCVVKRPSVKGSVQTAWTIMCFLNLACTEWQ